MCETDGSLLGGRLSLINVNMLNEQKDKCGDRILAYCRLINAISTLKELVCACSLNKLYKLALTSIFLLLYYFLIE